MSPRRFALALLLSPLPALAVIAVLLDLRDRWMAATPPRPLPLLTLLQVHLSWIVDQLPWAYLVTALIALPAYVFLTKRALPRLLPTLLFGLVAAIAAISLRSSLSLDALYLGALGGVAGALTYWGIAHVAHRDPNAAA